MTKYRYSRFTRHEPAYQVKFREVAVGEVRLDTWSGGRRKRWFARLTTDPLIVGRGRTRDAAVDDAYSQVGGIG